MKSFLEFKAFLTQLLTKFDGFDPSAISVQEFNILFSAYEKGVALEEIAHAVVDGSAYQRFFDQEDKKSRPQ